jgi:hypothetical protein
MMVSNGRDLWHAFTRMIKFVVVDEIHLSVFNMVHHNGLNCAQNVRTSPIMFTGDSVCSGWSAWRNIIRLLDSTTKQDAAVLHLSHMKSENMSTLPEDSHIFPSSASCN